ncbi:MAG: hypothetical protein H6581_06750 [Bacteroidia bacterium]|nr:hypothetical protein [Bacteroidia bacterium]
MERIRELYLSFNKNEKKHLKSYLSSLHTKGENKALELIEMLDKSSNISQEDASKALYGNPKSKAFIMMKSRLHERMLEILSLSLTLSSNEGAWGRSYSIERLKLFKEMTYAALLKQRGLKEQAMELFQKSYDSAVELGLPEMAVSALISLRHHYATFNQELYDDISQRINLAFEEYIMDTLAQGAHDRFRSLYGLKAQYDEPRKWLEENLPPLMEKLGDRDFPRAKFFINHLKINYYNFIKDYENCKQTLLETIELIKKSKWFHGKAQLIIPYIHLAMLELNFMNTREAIQYAKIAEQDQEDPGNMNHQVILLIKTYALLHQGNLKEARETLLELEQFSDKFMFSLNWGMMHFLRATLNFIEQDYELALQNLESVNNLSFDKEGWITGIKILEILINIDTDNLDQATAKIESLRKHVTKYEVEDRAKIIYQLLAGFEKTGYDFSQPVRNEKELLRIIEEVNHWIPSGYETIRFHKWFKYKRGLDGVTHRDIYVIGPGEKVK